MALCATQVCELQMEVNQASGHQSVFHHNMTLQCVMILLGMRIVKSQLVMMLLGTSTVMSQ